MNLRVAWFWLALGFARLATAAEAPGAEGEDWFGGSALNGMVRCHKCLFSDEEVRNGDIAFLLRGADSHHRYLTPLELETNGNNLPGRDLANLFYHHNKAALDFASALHPSDSLTKRGCTGAECLAKEVKGAAEHILEDLTRFQRLLQYAIAANATEGWLRKDAWDYNVAMYKASDIDVESLIDGIDKLRQFYQAKLGDASKWEQHGAPQFAHLIEKLNAAKAFSPIPSNVSIRQHSNLSTAAMRLEGRPVALEAPPEIPVTSLLVDPRVIDSTSLSEADREALAEVRLSWSL